MSRKAFFKDIEVNVTSKDIEVGTEFPNFKAVKSDLTDFNLEDYKGNILVINSFPSVDTGVCAMQTTKFNNEVSKYKNLTVVTVSKDLPFALGRFCSANGIDNAITVSDYKYNDFENKVGELIEEIKLLARAVYVVDQLGIVRYVERLEKIGEEPNYAKALEVVKTLI